MRFVLVLTILIAAFYAAAALAAGDDVVGYGLPKLAGAGPYGLLALSLRYMHVLDRRLDAAQAQLVALTMRCTDALATNADALRELRARRKGD